MENKVYDIIILWAGASGLFCASQILDSLSVLILEWGDSPAKKLLMSAKWRWNITNLNIDPRKDYVSDDSDFIFSAFEKFWIKDFLGFLNEKWIETKEENNGRILLKSGKVSEFKERLVNLVLEKWIEIKYNSEFMSARKTTNRTFEIKTSSWIYFAKNLIVATWWPSFPQLWASWVAIEIAWDFGLETTPFYPALVWFETKQDFSLLSGSSVVGELNLMKWNNSIYEENWPILFTHRWISWPAVFNTSLFIRENFYEKSSDFKVRISVSAKEITKRLLSFLRFRSNSLKEYKISTDIVKVRWLDEAKVCWWWVKLKNLNPDFECKRIEWLYFIWECLDTTGKTWWFNLQRCWTSWANCATGINKKFLNFKF